MQDINNWAIAIIGGAIATVIGGLLLRAIGNITVPKISLVVIAKVLFLWFLGFVFWLVGSVISDAVYRDCIIYSRCRPEGPVAYLMLMGQATTFIGTIALLGIASRLFRKSNK